MKLQAVTASVALLLAACGPGDNANVPGDTGDTSAYSGIAENDVLNLTGTEPFWGGTIVDETLTYATPDNQDGVAIALTRFAGRGGVSFSGELDGQALDLAITPAPCSDGMSDRAYPFAATLRIGSETREGCAWREGVDDLGGPP